MCPWKTWKLGSKLLLLDTTLIRSSLWRATTTSIDLHAGALFPYSMFYREVRQNHVLSRTVNMQLIPSWGAWPDLPAKKGRDVLRPTNKRAELVARIYSTCSRYTSIRRQLDSAYRLSCTVSHFFTRYCTWCTVSLIDPSLCCQYLVNCTGTCSESQRSHPFTHFTFDGSTDCEESLSQF